MTYTDLTFLPVQQALLTCLTTAVADLTNVPAIVGPRYGQEVVFDLAQNEDLCCDGFAWVRMGTATPAADNPGGCFIPVWQVELEVGIVACAPMGDDQNIVTEPQHIAANAMLAEMFMALRRVNCCFADAGFSYYTVGPWVPAGPLGGCLGGSMLFTVQVEGNDVFPGAPVGGDVFPFAPYVLGVDVGVPTGTALTATVGVPVVPDAIEDLLITHPIDGTTRLLTNVKVFRHRRWTATIQPHPGPGETFLFDECEFDVALDFFCVDLNDDNGVLDQMQPLAYFRRCSFDGNNTTGRCLNAAFTWVERCDFRNAEDGWGTAYGVGFLSNIVAGDDGGVDPHPDGQQQGGLGHTDNKLCWLSAGSAVIGNSAYRAGTEFSRIQNIRLHDCSLRLGGYNLQVRGDPGGRGVDGVEVLRCMFGGWGFGPVDFQDVTTVTWADNVDTDGNTIPSPV